MAAKTTSLSYCYLSVFTLMLMIASQTTCKASAAVPPPSPAAGYAGENSTEFIRVRCGATLYPRLCYRSLASYSSFIQQSPVQLACAAANVTLSRLAALAVSVAAHRRALPPGAAGARAAAALRDCADAVGDATDQVRRTAGELRGLERAMGPEVAWRVSNAQTWMSAALTNEDTCADGFQTVTGAGPGGAAKADVCRGVRRVKQFTSNALALVNALIAS